jgi:ABC-2 type transport system ATP-binding protein
LIPDSGTVAWNGEPIDGRTRRRFGYLPEERGLYGKMNVEDQIVYFGRLHGMHKAVATRRARAWMERLGVAQYARRPCAELSKGNQQKVQVACAAVHDPEFLILDEPFSGLDPVNAENLLGVLGELQRSGSTLVLSSHHMWQIEDLCTHISIISSGELRAEGSLAELRQAWPTRVVVVEPASPELAAVLSQEPGAAQRPTVNGKLAFDMRRDIDLPDLARRLTAAGDVTRFERLEPSLHDIYLRAIGAEI